MHDSAYAKFKDDKHREAADMLYYRKAKQLEGLYPQLAGHAVLAGNYTTRKMLEQYSPGALLGSAALKAGLGGLAGGLVGLTVTGIKNIHQSHQMANGTYRKDELEALDKYFKTDPQRDKYLDKFEKEHLATEGAWNRPGVEREIKEARKRLADAAAKAASPANHIADAVNKAGAKARLENVNKHIYDSVMNAAKSAGAKARGTAAVVKEKLFPTKVTPTADEIANSQAARWAHYRQLYDDAQHPRRVKRKKTKKNLKRATKIVPHLYM
jgi:hypothetical protein